MRRFIHAIAIAGVMFPTVASAHDRGGSSSGGSGAPASSASGSTGETISASGAGATSGPSDRPSSGSGSSRSAAQAFGEIIRGSTFSWDNSVSFETIFPGTQLSRDPSYQWWLSFRPRFQLHRNLSLRVRQDMTMEWFPTDSVTRDRTPVFGDLWTDLAITGIPPLAGFRFGAGIRAQWPLLNYASRSTGTYFSLGALVSVSRAFENVLGKGLNFSLLFIGSHPFTQYTTRSIGEYHGYDCQGLDYRPTLCTQLSGAMNIAFRLISSLAIGWTPIDHLDVGVSYILINDWTYAPPETVIYDSMGGTTVVERSPDDNRMRQASWFLASVDWEALPWLSFSLGMYTYRNVLNPDGRYGNPFWAPDGSTRVFLTTTFALDEIYNAFSGGSRQSGGGNQPQGRITMNRPEQRGSGLNHTVQQMRAAQIQNGTFF